MVGREVIREKDAQLEIASTLPSKYYRSNECYKKVEEYTNVNNRADILFVYKYKLGKPYSIVVEVKSRTTQDHLKPNYDYKRGNIFSGILMTLLLSIFVGYLGTVIIEVNWMQTALYISIFLFAIHTINELSNKINLDVVQSMKVIQQLDKYDANEKWIALPYDTFVNNDDLKVLKRACKKKGLGLIILEEDYDLNFICKPKPVLETNTFLNSYKNSESIYEEILELGQY